MAVALIKTDSPYKIEKGVPLPASDRAKYPLGQMEVGDSVMVDGGMHKVSSSVSAYSKKHGIKFTVRGVDATHTRIWRIA